MIDWSVALESVNSDRQLLTEVVQILLNELPDLHGDIRSAAVAHDAEALRNAAHKFKGSVRFLGPSTVYDLTESIELLDPMDFGRAEKWLATLAGELATFSSSLRSFVAESGS